MFGTFRIGWVDYGQYFIDQAGTAGQVWKSNWYGRGSRWSITAAASMQCPPRRVMVDEVTVNRDERATRSSCVLDQSNNYIQFILPQICDNWSCYPIRDYTDNSRINQYCKEYWLVGYWGYVMSSSTNAYILNASNQWSLNTAGGNYYYYIYCSVGNAY